MITTRAGALFLGSLLWTITGCSSLMWSSKPAGGWIRVQIVKSRPVVVTRQVTVDRETRTGRIRFEVYEAGRCSGTRLQKRSNGAGFALDVLVPLGLVGIGAALVAGNLRGNSEECDQSARCITGVLSAGTGLLWWATAIGFGHSYQNRTVARHRLEGPCRGFSKVGVHPDAIVVSLKGWLKNQTLHRGALDFLYLLKGLPLAALRPPSLLRIRTTRGKVTLDLGKAFSHLIGPRPGQAGASTKPGTSTPRGDRVAP